MTSDLDVSVQEDEDLLDRAYGVLSDSRRRSLLAAMRDSEFPVSMATLATRIAALEADASESEVSNATVQDVYLSLYHVHLPKLADVGAVSVDRENNGVSPGENFETVLALLVEE